MAPPFVSPGHRHADRGLVIGFLLFFVDEPENSLYISGDTVWYEGIREIGNRFAIRTALLFMGAARVRAVGEWHLTFTAAEAVEAARVFSSATIIHSSALRRLAALYGIAI